MKYGFNFGWVWDEITHLAERPKYFSVTVLATSSKLSINLDDLDDKDHEIDIDYRLIRHIYVSSIESIKTTSECIYIYIYKHM